jgi:glycosyltransferase involved in cell wall biosynthesis
VRIAIVNYVWDPELASAQALLDRYFTLTCWSEAVLGAGVAGVEVHQRFRTGAALERNGIAYRFWSDDDALHRAVASAAPQVVHVNGVLHPQRVRRLRARLPQETALVVQDHAGFTPAAASVLRRAWIRRGLAVADALLVAAPGQIDHWRHARILPQALSVADVMESSTTMAPLPKDEARRQSGVDGSPALLWVGRLNRNKDPHTVLRGAAAFFERHPGARLTMVYASADLEREVRDEVARSPTLVSRVRLVGRIPREEMPAYFSAADLFVLGSHREGSGYAAIDALACGACPVLTDIPSFRAITGDGSVGALWRPDDDTSLTEALDRAARMVAEDTRQACRTLFEDRFSWPVIGRRAMQIYEDVLASRWRSRAPAR